MLKLKMVPIWILAILTVTPLGFFLAPIFIAIAAIGGIAVVIHGLTRHEQTPQVG